MMLKHTMLAFLFCLTGSIANAQVQELQKTVICESPAVVISSLMEKWGEEPAWTGQDGKNGSQYVLLTNTKTKTWTLVQYNEELACVLGVGKGSQFPIFGKVSI